MKTLANNSSYNNMQLKETGFFGVWTEQWPRKYLPTHNLCIKLCLFWWPTVYKYFQSLV